MSNRTLVIAICLAIVTAALAWVTRPADRGPSAPLSEAAGTFTLQLDLPSITSIRVEADGYAAEVARDAGWQISLPVDEDAIDDYFPGLLEVTGQAGDRQHRWPADHDAVRAMLRDLTTIPLEVSEHDEDPPALITIHIAGSAEILIEVTGKPLAGRVPLRVTTNEGVRFASAPADRFRPLSIEDIAALAEPHPFATDGVIELLAIGPPLDDTFPPKETDYFKRNGLTLHRDAGLWTAAGTDARIDQALAADLVELVKKIRVSGVTVPVADMPRDEVAYVIGIQTSHPRQPGERPRVSELGLFIGQQQDIDGGVAAFAERSVPDSPRGWGLFTLDADTFPALPTTPDSLLDPVPLPWPAGETASISVEQGGQTATLRRTLKGWIAGDRPADTLAIRTLLTALGSAHPATLHADSDLEPIATITLGPIGTGDPVTLSVSLADSAVIVTDGAADWTIDDADGSIARSIDVLSP